ncbi:MAG: sensor histidine kinase [Anaerolineae bacterium]|nr:sensor histidine kinase [Anaerolineae bacterium]
MSDIPQAGTASPRDQLITLLRQEYDRVETQLAELLALVEQTHNEVNRLTQRSAAINNRLHQVESNFDSVPRQDIRVAYTEALDVRGRLHTMRGNLEKLQSDQEQYRHLEKLLAKILGAIEGISPTTFVGDVGVNSESNPAAANIVRVIEAQEGERQRLARQMHDGPAQSLTNFILQAEICQRLFDRNPDRAAEELNNLKTVASSTFQKVREFIFDLRPMMLDDLGLIPTIRRYVEGYEEKTSVQTDLHILGDERRLEQHREVIMFRSIQELLSNVRNHTKATKVTVTLELANDTITATVEDNGQGFKPETVFAQNSQPGSTKPLGLNTMRERLELINGSMTIDSGEGEGTRVTVRIPAGQPPSMS